MLDGIACCVNVEKRKSIFNKEFNTREGFDGTYMGQTWQANFGIIPHSNLKNKEPNID